MAGFGRRFRSLERPQLITGSVAQPASQADRGPTTRLNAPLQMVTSGSVASGRAHHEVNRKPAHPRSVPAHQRRAPPRRTGSPGQTEPPSLLVKLSHHRPSRLGPASQRLRTASFFQNGRPGPIGHARGGCLARGGAPAPPLRQEPNRVAAHDTSHHLDVARVPCGTGPRLRHAAHSQNPAFTRPSRPRIPHQRRKRTAKARNGAPRRRRSDEP